MPGTGKTHFGKLLSKSLRLQFFDIDECIEKSEATIIRQIIAEKGETYFREKEHEILLNLSKTSNSIISCGGGTAVFYNNIDVMKNTGIVIWLDTDLDIIAKRIAHNSSRRPLFIGLNQVEIRIKLGDLYAKRRKVYAKADIVTEIIYPHNKSLSTVIQKIMKISQRRNR